MLFTAAFTIHYSVRAGSLGQRDFVEPWAMGQKVFDSLDRPMRLLSVVEINFLQSQSQSTCLLTLFVQATFILQTSVSKLRERPPLSNSSSSNHSLRLITPLLNPAALLPKSPKLPPPPPPYPNILSFCYTTFLLSCLFLIRIWTLSLFLFVIIFGLPKLYINQLQDLLRHLYHALPSFPSNDSHCLRA